MLLGDDGGARPSIFAEMSALAARTGAINLGQGFPDEDGPPEVLEVAQRAIASGVNQYPPGQGTLDLRRAIAEHQARFYGLHWDPEGEVLVTAGATEALAATLLALLEPGDELIVFEPFYDSYAAIAALAGATVVTIPLRWPAFAPEPDDIRAAFTRRTRAILVNSPHNPTGTVFSDDTLRLIGELAVRHDCLIVTDEVYEHLRYGVPHRPIATIDALRDRTVSISSGGKTFNTTGWKIGWITARAELVTAILAVKQFLTFVNGAPFQPAIAAGLRLPDEYFRNIAVELEHKRDVLSAGLREAGFRVSEPRGSYFVVADARPLGFDDGAELCRRLPELAGVVAVPLIAFIRPEHRDTARSLVRFAFCKRLDVLSEAASRLSGLRDRATG